MPLSSIYVSNIPQANQQINNTQPQFNGNFQAMAELIAVNHVPFNTADEFGKHALVDYVIQSVDPTTGPAEIALYSKLVDNDVNKAELFYRYPNNGNVVQLSGSEGGSSGTTSGGSYATGTNPSGFTYLAGTWQYISSGLLLMTGEIELKNTSVLTGEFPIATGVPQFSNTPFVFVITNTNNVSSLTYYSADIVSSTQYKCRQTVSQSSVLGWMAIGV